MPMAATEWYDISWVDWLSVAGLPLTMLGLVLAWLQARAAARSAERARAAIEYTERRLRANQLNVLVPQLRFISRELDLAIENDDTPHARRELDNWCWQAGSIHGLLSAVGPDLHDEVSLELIQSSIGLASTASRHLTKANQAPVQKRCARAQDAIVKVCNELNSWVSKNATLADDRSVTR